MLGETNVESWYLKGGDGKHHPYRLTYNRPEFLEEVLDDRSSGLLAYRKAIKDSGVRRLSEKLE